MMMKKTNKFAFLFLVAMFMTSFPLFATTNESQISSARDMLETARTFMKSGKFMKAIYHYDTLLSHHKESEQEASWALYEKSYCYYKLKKFNIAMKGFESIKREYPNAYGPITLADKMLSKIQKRKEK